MAIQLNRDYKGRLTKFRVVPQGIYEEDDPRIRHIVEYLVENDFAEYVKVSPDKFRAPDPAVTAVDYQVEPDEETLEPEDSILDITGLSEKQALALYQAGYETFDDLNNASDEDLLDVDGIGPSALDSIRRYLAEYEG